MALAVPPGWFVKESMTVLAPDGQANAIFSSEPLEPAIDPQTYAHNQGELLSQEFPGYQEISFGPTSVSLPSAGYLRHFTWTPPDGVPITQLQLYSTRRGRSYTATATSPTSTFPRFDGLFREIMRSLGVSEYSASDQGGWWHPSLHLAVPAGWWVKESLTALAPDGRGNVIFSSEPLDPSIDTETYSGIQGALLSREFPWFRQFSFGPADARLPDAHLRHFDWTPADGVPVTQFQLYATQPGRGYTATATATTTEFARYQDVFRSILGTCSARPDPGPPPPPKLLPEEAQARLRELRRAQAVTYRPPAPAAVAGLLDEVAQAVRAIHPDPQVAATLEAARGVQDAGALHRAGQVLLDVGLGDLAVAPLAQSYALAPTSGTAIALSLALEQAGSPAQAAGFYRDNPWIAAQDESARGLYSHFAAMSGDWQATYDMALGIDPSGPNAALRERAARRLGRVNALHASAGLGSDDVRGWTAVLAGTLLLCRAPDDHVGMNGRFAAKWEQEEEVVARLAVLRAVLTRARRLPTSVVAGADRDSQVLGWTIANVFGLPAPTTSDQAVPPGSTTLAAVFDWSNADDRFTDRYLHARDTVIFAYSLDWTKRHPLAPDITAIEAQAVFAPWHERMRLDGSVDSLADPDPDRRPKVVMVPPADRPPTEIAADLAKFPTPPPSGSDFEELLRTVDALATRPGDVGLLGGPRDEYFPNDPVASAKFV